MQLRIKTRLFLNFTLLSSILVATSSYLFYSQLSKDLLIRVEETNRQQLYRYQEALDHVIEDMDRISAQVIYSSDIKNYLYERLDEDTASYQSFAKRKKYEDLLASLNGPWFIASQINLIAMDGFFLTYGQNLNTASNLKESIPKTKWIDETLALSGDKLIVPPHISQWQEDRPVYFSLARSFSSPPSQPAALVEIQQPYELLSDTIERGQNEQLQTNVYIINDKGEMFYPNPEGSADPADIPRWTGDVKEFKREDSRETDIWSQMRSDFSGLTVLIQQPKSEVMQPIAHLRKIVLILAILGETISLLIAYILSERIASPIRYLQKRLEKMSIDNVNTATVKKLKNIQEIGLLYETFEEMRIRLNQSLNEVIQSQQRENVAHLQAMYAQMNPHFLFNTLTSMASFAEESGFPEFGRISQRLSSMLRYSTNSFTQSVNLKQELNYTVQYMELMRFRYEGQFSFTVDLDPALEQEPLPKFLLQPLVENSFAHGFQLARPPWIIGVSINVSKGSSSWEIRIHDNGSGFTDSAYDETCALMEELNDGRIRQMEHLSAQGLGRMGIVNTLTRCRLFWNEKVQFALNRLPQGMEVTITIRR